MAWTPQDPTNKVTVWNETAWEHVNAGIVEASGTSVTSIAGHVDTAANLPASAEQDVAYVTQDTKHLWVWDGTEWIDLGTVQGPAGSDATVTDPVVAAAIGDQTTAALGPVIDARTGNGQRPVGRGEVVINASHHGISPANDGATNRAALAALLTSVGSASTPRVILLDQRGTYDVAGGQVELAGVGVTLRGLGVGATTLRVTSTPTYNGVVKITGASCTVEDMSLAANSQAEWGLWATPTAIDHRVTRVEIKGARHHGVHVDGSPRPIYTSVTSSNNGTEPASLGGGFYMVSATDPAFTDCRAADNSGNGYYLRSHDKSGLTMVACRASGNGRYGMSIRYNRMAITGCYSWGNTGGSLSVHAAYQEPEANGELVVISGSIFGGSTSNASEYDALVERFGQVIVSGCYFDAPVALRGLYLRQCSDVDLTGTSVRYRRLSGGSAALYLNAVAGGSITGGSVISDATSAVGIRMDNCSDIRVDPARIVRGSNGVYLTGVAGGTITVGANVQFKGVANLPVLDTSTNGHRRVEASVSYGGAAPTSGVYRRGDLVLNAAATVGQPTGWQCVYGGSASSATWAASTAYARGDWIRGAASVVRECIVAGTSGATFPTWATAPAGTTVVDGTVTWFTHTNALAEFSPLPSLP